MGKVALARSGGHSDQDILGFLSQSDPGFSEKIKTATEAGYQPKEIVDYLHEQETKDRGFFSSIQRGYRSGVTGLVTGSPEDRPPEDEGFMEHIGSLIGETVSDLPAMGIGGAAGGMVGVAGGPVGVAMGAGAGAFALPAMIKTAFGEYRKHANSGGKLTFGEFLKSAGEVGAAGTRSAVLGAAMPWASKLFGVLGKSPKLMKVLNITPGQVLGKMGVQVAEKEGAKGIAKVGQKLLKAKPLKAVAKAGGTGTTLATGSALLEGRIPTVKEIMDNTAVVLGFHIANPTAAKIQSKLKAKGITLDKFISDLKRDGVKTEAGIEKHAEPTIAESETVFRKFIKKMPEGIQDKLDTAAEKMGGWREAWKRKQPFFKLVREQVSKSQGDLLKSFMKWNEVEADLSKNLSRKDLAKTSEEMMYYLQKTGNPFEKGDTFEALSKRLSPKAKQLADKLLRPHFEETLAKWNANPATKDINPRGNVKANYLPHLYEQSSINKFKNKINEIDNKYWGRDLKTKNPHASMKKFLSYHEALQKAGLKPLYKNVFDLVKHYDATMSKITAQNELWKSLKDINKETGQDIFVTSKQPKKYAAAKKKGWVPFESSFLRKTITGVKKAKPGQKKGEPKWGLTTANALVNPDAAPALQGVFLRKKYEPLNKFTEKFWNNYDKLGNFVRRMRVQLSLFHYGALTESAFGSMGLKGLNVKGWLKLGKTLQGNKEFLTHWRKHGLEFRVPDELKSSNQGKFATKIVDKIPEKFEKTKAGAEKLVYNFQKVQNYLFDTFHPRLKLVAANHYHEQALNEFSKKHNREPTKAENSKMSNDIADIVNNQFGGQMWEVQQFFNDPRNLKWTRRLIGYPDWTLSAAKQAANAFSGGVKGRISRRYWLRYGVGFLAFHNIARFITGGFSSEKEKDSVKKGKLWWSPTKAWKELNDPDPTKANAFPLPDMEFKVGDVTINPGRDDKGRRLHTHAGKQMLEIGRYVTSPISALFTKANPIIQAIGTQAIGGTPYEGGVFPAQGKWEGGKFKQWGGSRPGTLKRAAYRAKEAASNVVPFSVSRTKDVGLAPAIATGFTLPIAKGMSLTKAEPLMLKAIKKNNRQELKKIIEVLRANGYEMKSIKRTITRVRKEVKN